MTAALATCVVAALLARAYGSDIPDVSWCEAPARTHAGWVCGEHRRATSGALYASFLAVPYAKQPLGDLRFQELQPVEPWRDVLNATAEGPVCPQTDVLYKGLMQAKGGMSEACIHANIHVPLEAMPAPAAAQAYPRGSRPILVFIHGGGFAIGSGDTDLHGPEYLVSKDVIVITFNYRLNIFGFLSLNSTEIPGNNGLRDAVTLLRWVRRNARYFGGDPDDITIAGQSAGAVMAHMLTLSPAAQGLFKSAICMSGVASSDFFSSSAQFARIIADLLLSILGLDASLPASELHRRLVETPLDKLMQANKALLDVFGTTTFVPVVESVHPGVTRVLPAEPEELMRRGYGSGTALLLGHTDAEAETFRARFQEFDIVAKLNATPAIAVTPRLTYIARAKTLPSLIAAVHERYLSSDPEDGFVRYASDAYFVYPAVRVAELRAAWPEARTYLYRFSYGGQRSAIKQALGLRFRGAGHIEDLTYVFRPNSFLGPLADEATPDGDTDSVSDDDKMVDIMTDIVVNFMNYTAPAPSYGAESAWPSSGPRLLHQSIAAPGAVHLRVPDENDINMKAFFDGLYRTARGH